MKTRTIYWLFLILNFFLLQYSSNCWNINENLFIFHTYLKQKETQCNKFILYPYLCFFLLCFAPSLIIKKSILGFISYRDMPIYCFHVYTFLEITDVLGRVNVRGNIKRTLLQIDKFQNAFLLNFPYLLLFSGIKHEIDICQSNISNNKFVKRFDIWIWKWANWNLSFVNYSYISENKCNFTNFTYSFIFHFQSKVFHFQVQIEFSIFIISI